MEKIMAEFICYDCKIIFEVDDKECEGYYNWKCPECGHIAKGSKNVNFNMPSNKVSRQKMGEFRKWKPSWNYLQKTYDNELYKPYDEFRKKK